MISFIADGNIFFCVSGSYTGLAIFILICFCDRNTYRGLEIAKRMSGGKDFEAKGLSKCRLYSLTVLVAVYLTPVMNMASRIQIPALARSNGNMPVCMSVDCERMCWRGGKQSCRHKGPEGDAPEGHACCARDPNARHLQRDPCDSLAVQAAG